MIVNQETLEFDSFYRRLQDRYIPIKKQSNNFLENYNDTVEEEFIKYLKLLEIQEKDYNERENQKALLVLKNILPIKNKRRKKVKNKYFPFLYLSFFMK